MYRKIQGIVAIALVLVGCANEVKYIKEADVAWSVKSGALHVLLLP